MKPIFHLPRPDFAGPFSLGPCRFLHFSNMNQTQIDLLIEVIVDLASAIASEQTKTASDSWDGCEIVWAKERAQTALKTLFP